MPARMERVEAAKAAAVRMLAGRDLTRLELTERLGQRGHSAEVVEQAVLELEAQGVVDDARVASEYARRSLEDRSLAASLVEATLLERGVDGAIVQRVMGEVAAGRNAQEEALELARQRVRRSKPDLEPTMVIRRAFEFLRRRGYDEETSHSAAERAAREYLGGP